MTRRGSIMGRGWPATDWRTVRYVPIELDEPAENVVQGYSAVLNLYLRWENGALRWHDPATGQHIATFDTEREGRLEAEARVRVLEEENRRLRNG